MARRAAKRSFNIREAKGASSSKRGAVDVMRPRRQLGWMKGQLTIPDDFDRPLPESALRAFEGKRR